MKRKIAILIIFLSIAFPVQASWFQIEVIVFEYVVPDSDSEMWYENPGLPSRENSIELITEMADTFNVGLEKSIQNNGRGEETDKAAELFAYMTLPDDKYRLHGVYRVLKLSHQYRPLMHVAWQQEGLNSAMARYVHMEMLLGNNEAENPLNSEIDVEQLIEQVYIAPELKFDGTIRLRSRRFLHLDVDFAYFPESFEQYIPDQSQVVDETSMFINQQADYVRLTESRKIKLNELHYFDHPMFGVIIQVSRLKVD